MAYCEECGAKLPPDASFCEECGAKVTSKSVSAGNSGKKSSIGETSCEGCGAKLPPDATFCDECGAPLHQAKKSILDDILNGAAFDDTKKKMSIFTTSDWAQEWSKFAKNTADHELGIIMTNVSALAKQLDTTVSKIEEEIYDYIVAANKRGVEYCLLRLDKNAIVPDVSESNSIQDVEGIVDLLRAVVDVTRPKYLFILGNEDIIDVATWDNEGDFDDPDFDVDSDFVYSVLDTTSPWEGQNFNLSEALRVGRLPTTENEFSDFQTYLRNAATGIGSFDRKHAYGLSAKVWEEESQFEFDQIRDDGEGILSETGANLLFFNLHGSDEASYWLGQDNESYTKAVLPVAFFKYPNPFFLGVEACYGARYIGLPSKESILKISMSNKCLAFLGSSRIAMGSCIPEERCCADILIGEFMKQISRGETAGDAHLQALESLIDNDRKEWNRVIPPSVKTLAEFSLYGDPSASMGKNKNIGKARKMLKAIGGTPKGIHIPMPDVRKAAKVYLSEVNAELDAQIDAFAAQYLPPEYASIQQKGIPQKPKVYQVQNSDLYNKTFSYNTKFGRCFVSVFFDKHGKKRKAFLSK